MPSSSPKTPCPSSSAPTLTLQVFSWELLWELSDYCQRTGKWKEFPQTVPATATAANKIGQIHEVAVFNSSLCLPATACDMVAQQQGWSRL